MSEIISAPYAPDNEAAKYKALVIYGLYLAALLGGVTAFVGLVMAYVFRSDAPDWLKSHYAFLIRTFWIGLLYSAIALMLCVVLIGFFLFFALTIWWIVRCVQGLDYASKRLPIPTPNAWWFLS